MILDYAKLVWEETPGPKRTVIAMSLVVGLTNGAVLSIINRGLEARIDGTLSWHYPALFVAISAIFVIANYFAMYRATEMSGALMHRLRGRMSVKLAGSSLRAVEEFGRGDIIAHITTDIRTLGVTALDMVKVFHSAVLVAFCLMYLFWLSPLVFVLTGLFIVLGVGFFLWQEHIARRLLSEARADQARYYGTLTDSLDGFKEIRLNRAVKDGIMEDLATVSDRFRKNYARAEFVFFSGSVSSQVFLFAMLGIVAFVPEAWIMTAGVSTFQILAVLLFMMAPLEALVDFIGPYTRADVARRNLERLSEAMDQGREPSTSAQVGLALDKPIVLEGATAHYSDPALGRTFTLGPVDLRIEPGEIVFLVGGNGSGKTTLMKVIAGLYPPHDGKLKLGDKVIDGSNLSAYRAMVSAVFSDFHLFPHHYGLDPLPIERMESDLERVGLSDKVHVLEDCFDTLKLSTGQRKRLALVVALAHQRSLLLLDEFGAEQDPDFRTFFYRHLLPSLRDQGLSVVVVSHDDRFFDCCDRVVKMDFGQIVDIRDNRSIPEKNLSNHRSLD
jgi:putative pyoverdin transport system ATP-binding/permease protein